MWVRIAGGVGVGLALLLAGCARQPDKVATTPPAPEPAWPQMPSAGMHDDLEKMEAIWHLRAALNVAALSCASRHGQIVSHYNAVLARHKTVLAAAYTAETDSARATHGAAYKPALDAHMTKLYNYFAWPPAQEAFCREAAAVAAEAAEVKPAAFEAFSPAALARIDRAFTTPPAARHIAAAEPPPAKKAKAVQTASLAASPVAAASTPAGKAPAWRIQVGAFTGQRAAEAAWARVQTQSPGLATYQPYYEQVPARPQLVRLQLGAGDNRASALRLCALAAAAGLECLPVGRP